MEVNEDSDNILIKSDKGSFKIKGIPADDYPNLPFVESGTSLNIDPGSFLKALNLQFLQLVMMIQNSYLQV